MNKNKTIQGNFRIKHYIIISAWLLAFTLVGSACSRSTTSANPEPAPSPTTPATARAGTALTQRPAGETLSQYIKFDHLTTDDGLSNDSIWGIAQDSRGFMWFGTLEGLNRYDGNNFTLYRHDPDDPHSLSGTSIRGVITDQTGTLWIGTWSNGLNQFDRSTERFIRYQHDPDDLHTLSNDSIRSLLVDRTGALWVGTANGLNKFDRSTKQFTRYQQDPDNPNSLGGNVIEALYEDRAGILWVSTGAGLDQFDPATEQFVHYQNNPKDPLSLSDNIVRSIYEDSSGTLWVGTMAGLNKFDRDTEQFIRYQYDPDDPSSLSHDAVYHIYEDKAGILWVGTWGGGLNMFDRDTETFTQYQSNSADPYSLSGNNVWQIYEDPAGMAWIATDGGGISILDRGGKPFLHYRSIPGDPNSLSSNAVRAIYADQEGILWIGTNSGGLAKFDPQTEQITHYKHEPGAPNSLRSNSVWVIYEDNLRNLWLGGYSSGLIKFDRDTEKFTYYLHDPGNPHSLSNNSIWAISEDRTGTLWIGTNGGGLNKFDRETEQFTDYQHDPADPSTLSHNQVTNVYEDRSGVLWVGTMGGGLNKFDRENGQFAHYKHDQADPNSLAVNAVFPIYEDRKDRFWIGTMGGGLDEFDRENEQFIHYSINNGLSSNTVWGILEEDTSSDDEDGNLWLSTSWGLSRFNPQTETFRNYDISDGLQGNTFLAINSYHKSNSGEMLFGGANGFSAFYPDQIVDNPNPPPVFITNFQLANKPVPIGGDSVLQKSILETDELVLSYQDNVFSFEFAALNLRAPEKNRYKYKMEGFEDDWNEVDSTRRFATYTHLNPGDYVFRVIASNNDGVWNEEGDSVKITITPPWWGTTWFRIGMGVLVIGLLVGGYYRRVKSLENRSRKLEALVQERSEALNSAEEQIRIIFENAQVGIAFANFEGDLLAANPALLSMMGYTEEEALNLNVSSFYADPAERTVMLQQLKAENALSDFGAKNIRKDGTVFFVSLNVSMTRRGGQDVLLVLVEDVTDQLSTEQTSAVFKERERLARDLHDAVTQTLFSASVIAEATPQIWDKDEATGRRYLEQLPIMLRGALAEMRMLLLELRPSSVRDQTLGQLLEPLADAARAYSRAQVDLNIDSDGKFPEDVTISLLRIVQECLNNAAKHSNASQVDIRLIADPEGVEIHISDNGIGFNPDSITTGSLGIGIMLDRAQNIGAVVKIDSETDYGTEVVVTWSNLEPSISEK